MQEKTSSVTIIVGKAVPYRPQRDNQYFPSTTCNTTAMIHALEIGEIPFIYPPNMQPEDYLTQILEDESSVTRMKKLYNWAIGKYRPRHIHAMLSWAVNERLVGKNVTFFTERATINHIIASFILSRMGVVVSTMFTQYGHIVTAVGVETEQTDIEQITSPNDIDRTKVTAIYVNDPWGNVLTNYKDHNGYHIRVPYRMFIDKTKTLKSETKKMAHFFYTNETIPDYLKELV